MKLITKLQHQKLVLIILTAIVFITTVSVQQLYDKTEYFFESKTPTKFKLFTFSESESKNGIVKSIFFAKNAYKNFSELKKKTKVLFASSASFVSSVNEEDKVPVGFSAQNGTILNKLPHTTMDGLVIINNNVSSIASIKIIDLDKESIDCGVDNCKTHFEHTNIRNSPAQTYEFIKAVENNNISIFQTQLVYTNTKTDLENFNILTNGNNDRSRRFLAICKKDNVLQHVVVDSVEEDFLMASAKNAIDFLRSSGFVVENMVNLDTGSKDILHAYNGYDLKNLRPNSLSSSATIENASSLLVYYTEI